MQREIKLTLSPVKRSSKPTDGKAEDALINSKNTVSITLEKLAEAVADGQSFCHGVFSGRRVGKNFISSDLVVLDIDNKNTDTPLTIEKALERLKDYGLDCNFIYTSFSDTIPKGETDFEVLKTAKRYRMVFLLPDTIRNLEELYKLIDDKFYPLFPEADRAVTKIQLWFGGINIAYTNFDYLLDLEVFNSIVAIQMTSHLKAGKRKNEKLKEFAAIPCSLMWGEGGCTDVQNTAMAFNKHKADAENRTVSAVRNFDWVWACSQFELLDSFLNCKAKIYHDELLYLYLAMSKIEGGVKKWKEAVKNNPEIDSQKLIDIAYYLEKRIQFGYQLFERRISKYAPNDKAAGKYDFLTNISNKLNGKIYEEILPKISLQEASNTLNQLFTETLSSSVNGKYVFKCATGLGKTEEIIKANNLEECLIAVPTHKLKEEISARLKKAEVEHFVVPDVQRILPDLIKYEYDALSKIGAYDKAASLLREVSSSENVSKFSISEDEQQRVRDELSAYFKAIKDCQDTSFPVLTTHKKLLNTEFPNHSTYIIDEDIIPSLFEVKSTTSKDLRMLIRKLKQAKYNGVEGDIEHLSEFYDALGQKYLGKVMESKIVKDMFSPVSIKRFINIAIKQALPMEGSPIGLLNSDFFFVASKDDHDPEGDKVIHYIKNNFLPADKKIIVLSATANKEMYEHLLGEIDWHELSQVEQVGKLVQVHDNSFSRAWMNKSESKETIEYVRNFANERPVITFKKHKNRFKKSANVCLESSEGFDELKGQDIVVVGTPHLQIGVYALLATALGIPFSSDDLKLEMVKCEHQNQRFDFYTFKHEGLRKVQFYKIESQLTQACGRARAIRESVNVHLFSNFPLAGFEKITLAELKRRENAEPMTSKMPVWISSGSKAA